MAAAPLAAQTSEVGIMIGASKRLISRSDQAAGTGVKDNFTFSNSDREKAWASSRTQPSAMAARPWWSPANLPEKSVEEVGAATTR